MAKTNRKRIDDAIFWMVMLRTEDGGSDESRIQRVGQLLQSQSAQIPDNIGGRMSIGNSGTED